MSKETMQLALDEFKHIKQWCLRSIGIGLVNENVLTALEEALAKQEQGEPVAYLNPDDVCADTAFRWCKIDEFTQPVYTTPQPAQKPWVGLTDEEKIECSNFDGRWDCVEATEAKLKEKNNV
jgi:hypothetical protein